MARRKQDAASWLRKRIRAHNWNLLITSLIAVLVSAGLYAILYGVGYWLWIFVETVTQGLEARAPLNYPKSFAVVMGSLFFIDGIWRSWTRWVNHGDRKILGPHVFWELVRFPSSFLMDALESFGAWIGLRRAELQFAVDLVEWIREEGRIALDGLPALFPANHSVRVERTLVALRILEILELTTTNRRAYLGLRRPEDAAFFEGDKKSH